MANENKISVDVNIDGQNQINQFTKTFDTLRNSINNLSQPLNSFSSNLNDLDKNLSRYTDSLSNLVDQNQKLTSTADKSQNKVSELSTSFITWDRILTILKINIEGWTVALTGGLTIITAFLPEIINFAKALFKGKDAIDQAKLSLDALNKGLSSTEYSKAIENVDTLKIKVDLAKKGFIQKSEVVKEYNKTIGQTIGQVKTLDQVETSLKDNAANYIKMVLAKATAMQAVKEAADNQVLAAKERNKSDEESVDYMLSGLPKTDRLYKENAEKNREEAAKPYKEKATQLEKIAEHYLVDVSNLTNKIEEKSPVTVIKKQIGDLQKTVDAKVVGSKTFKQLKLLKKQLKDLEQPADNGEVKPSKENLPKNSEDHPDKSRHLETISIDFAKTIELQKQNYDTELAALDDQLAKKLISQEQYQGQSKQLKEKYHQDIGGTISNFAQNDLDKAYQNLQEYYKQNKKRADDAAEEKKKHIQELHDFELQTAQSVSNSAFSILQNNIKSQSQAKLKQLDTQKQAELSNTTLTSSQKQAIEAKYKKKEAEEKTKAFKAEQRASILQAVINGALAITKTTAQTGIFATFAIPAIIAETAIQVATIAAQKTPQYAKGGLHYQSDGKGALLSGYSRTDNTNAYLRSGEAVVVSEAMRNPWARNLVSAINVAHGGRDFSITNPGRGYAIGGIFTDGGNSNRYYNQPMNDQKDLANTIAYQMINNFPPVYVDVKDINSQQNILAQTVNRVNL